MDLIKISKDKIISHWDSISQEIGKHLPPTVLGSDAQVEYTHWALINEKMQMWILVDEDLPCANIITQFTGEPGTEIRNLLIYTLVGFKPLTDKMIDTGWKVLMKFAKQNECFKIIAYTNVPRIVEMAIGVGAKAEYVLVTKEVNDG